MTEIKTWIKIKEKFPKYRFIFYNYGGTYFFEITDSEKWANKKREIPDNYEEAVLIVLSVIRYPEMTCANCYFLPDAYRRADCKYCLCKECYISKFYKQKGIIECGCGKKGNKLEGKELERKSKILHKHL